MLRVPCCVIDGFRIRLRVFAFGVEVEAAGSFAAQETGLRHFAQGFRDAHSVFEMSGKGLGNVQGDVYAHFVEEAHRSHRHAKVEHRFVEVSNAGAGSEQIPRFDQVRHEDAVDKKTGAVFDDDGQFAAL